ncbi:hypothetical protein V6N11_069534 [Hibiscus sabdariffa]|uniref:Uncharacterized protein n=1 Tax=Hibiscus sabdariffa TaxID=183260 RepID=A0ABR2Q3R4_9ROSI
MESFEQSLRQKGQRKTRLALPFALFECKAKEQGNQLAALSVTQGGCSKDQICFFLQSNRNQNSNLLA